MTHDDARYLDDVSYLDDVEVVLVTERVQDGGDGALGDGEALARHAAAGVQQDDDILGRAGRLDVPAPHTVTYTGTGMPGKQHR